MPGAALTYFILINADSFHFSKKPWNSREIQSNCIVNSINIYIYATTQPVDLCCCWMSHSLFFDRLCVSFSACCLFIEFVDPLTFSLSLSLSRFTFYFHDFMCMNKNFLCSFTHMAIFSRFVFFCDISNGKRVRKEKHSWFGLSLADYHRNVDIATHFWR